MGELGGRRGTRREPRAPRRSRESSFMLELVGFLLTGIGLFSFWVGFRVRTGSERTTREECSDTSRFTITIYKYPKGLIRIAALSHSHSNSSPLQASRNEFSTSVRPLCPLYQPILLTQLISRRPTWDPAQGKDSRSNSRMYSSRDMASHTRLKFRQVSRRVRVGVLQGRREARAGEEGRREAWLAVPCEGWTQLDRRRSYRTTGQGERRF